MSDSELAIVAAQTFQAPFLIERAGPTTRKKFFEFFTVPIRNANTRAAYYRAIQQTSEREKGVSRLRGREAPFWVYDLAAIDNLAELFAHKTINARVDNGSAQETEIYV